MAPIESFSVRVAAKAILLGTVGHLFPVANPKPMASVGPSSPS